VAATEPNSLLASTLTDLEIQIHPTTYPAPPPSTTYPSSSGTSLACFLYSELPPQQTTQETCCGDGPNLFSTNSVYQMCADPGIPRKEFVQLWWTNVLPRVKFFLWLLLHDKLNTAANLHKKGCPAIQSCVLCSHNLMETADHLCSNCRVTADIHISILSSSTQQFVLESWTTVCVTKSQLKWASIAWTVWKERNMRIFRHTARTTPMLIQEVKEQAVLWEATYQRQGISVEHMSG
jgi:zinc-binding in reverse transcriptase